VPLGEVDGDGDELVDALGDPDPDDGLVDGLGLLLLTGRTEGAGLVRVPSLNGGSCCAVAGVELTGGRPGSAAYTATDVPRRTTPTGDTRST
jgi:hypothetical protein